MIFFGGCETPPRRQLWQVPQRFRWGNPLLKRYLSVLPQLPSAFFSPNVGHPRCRSDQTLPRHGYFFATGDKGLGGGEGRRTLEATTATTRSGWKQVRKICPNSPQPFLIWRVGSSYNPWTPKAQLPRRWTGKMVFFSPTKVLVQLRRVPNLHFLARIQWYSRS